MGSVRIYLSRRNLLALLSKLDRARAGGQTVLTIIKCDNLHAKYPQSIPECIVTAVEDDDYYGARAPGPVHPDDDPANG